MNIFSKKKKVNLTCFFCNILLDEKSAFTLQYKSIEGLHTQKMCKDCSKIFDELADMKEEAYD